MEEELQIDKEYQKGFNSGYRIGKYSPELSQAFSGISLQKDMFATGLTDGISEQHKEMHREEGRLEQLSQIRDSATEQNRDIDLTK